MRAVRRDVGNVTGNVSGTAAISLGLDFKLLKINRDTQMRHTPVGERRTTSEFRNVLYMLGSHATGVIDAHIHEQLVEFYILLRMGVSQVVKLHACEG